MNWGSVSTFNIQTRIQNPFLREFSEGSVRQLTMSSFVKLILSIVGPTLFNLHRHSVAFESVKPVAENRAVGEDVLIGNDRRRARHRRPTCLEGDIHHRLKGEIAVVRLPGEYRVSVE